MTSWRRKLPVGLLVVAAAFGPWRLLTDGGSPAPPGPPPAQFMKSTDEVIEFWQDRVQRNGSDFISRTRLGEAFVRKARETGDVLMYQKAEGVLREVVDRRPDYEPALSSLGAVRFVQHDWAGAFDLAQRARALDPTSLQAIAVIGDVNLERGAYDEAETAYRDLQERSDTPAVIGRLARVAWLRGRTADALSLARLAAAQAGPLPGPGRDASWHGVQLADLLFDAGQLGPAAAEYERVLDGDPTYNVALAGLGGVRAAAGRLDEAAALYQRAVDILPEPHALAALGDLQLARGRPEDARRHYETADAAARLGVASGAVSRRDLAIFYADHDRDIDTALALASAELESRQDIYTWDAVAWSLFKADRAAEAAQAAEHAVVLGTPDAALLYHAGMAQAAAGNRARAQDLLSRALAVNAKFDVVQAPLAARTLEGLRAG